MLKVKTFFKKLVYLLPGKHTVYRMSAATDEEKDQWIKCVRWVILILRKIVASAQKEMKVRTYIINGKFR